MPAPTAPVSEGVPGARGARVTAPEMSPGEGSSTQRVLLCVAASVLFHVILSVALPALEGLAPARIVTQAHAAMNMFDEAVPIEMPLPEPEPEVTPEPAATPTPTRRHEREEVEPTPRHDAPEPAAAEADPQPVPEPEPEPTPTVTPAATSTVGTSTEGGLHVAARQGSGAISAGRSTEPGARVTREAPAVDHRGLYRSYRSLITRRVRPLARYPRLARSARIEGVVVVALRVDRRGNIIGRSIARSSGNASLDRAAMEGTQDLRIPAPPEGLLSMWNEAQVIRVRVPFAL